MDRKLDLGPDKIKQFIFAYGKEYGSGSRKWMHNSLRSFLRFAQFQGYVSQDFTPVVPVYRIKKLAQTSAIITDDQIRHLLNSIDRSTPLGMRDYAIIQLFFSYGVRGIQIRTLKLTDLSWRTDEIHFPAVKRGFPLVQVITAEVGDSLLVYLTKARPQNSVWPEVFVTGRAPFHPLLK